MDKLEVYLDYAVKLLMGYAPKLLLALVTLIVGFWVIRRFVRIFKKQMHVKNIDESLRTFLVSFISIVLKILLIISVMYMVGIEMTSFVAVLAASFLAIGMALSGTLQNFAGGVMILLFKPFKVGDFIDAQGYTGTVREIQIFHTILLTPDNKTVIIPNGGLSNSSMVNFSTQPNRRVDFTFGIGYEDDIDKAKNTLMRLIENDDRIFKDPAPFIGLVELADSSVNFAVRVWVKASDYWGVFFDMQENVKKTFDNENIGIPYPQTDVHLHQVK